jgi:hypothetical protein
MLFGTFALLGRMELQHQLFDAMTQLASLLRSPLDAIDRGAHTRP